MAFDMTSDMTSAIHSILQGKPKLRYFTFCVFQFYVIAFVMRLSWFENLNVTYSMSHIQRWYLVLCSKNALVKNPAEIICQINIQ